MNCTEIILSYKNSEALIKARINELNCQIKAELDQLLLDRLNMRKNILETELDDIKEVIQILNDYAGGNINCKDA